MRTADQLVEALLSEPPLTPIKQRGGDYVVGQYLDDMGRPQRITSFEKYDAPKHYNNSETGEREVLGNTAARLAVLDNGVRHVLYDDGMLYKGFADSAA